MARTGADRKTIDEAQLVVLATRMMTWLERHHRAASPPSREPWTLAIWYLASAEQLQDHRSLAVSRALVVVLGRSMDVSNVAFQQAAEAVKSTRALVDSVKAWQSSPAICSIIDNVLRQHRDLTAGTFIRAADRARALSPWWRWTAWLETALRNPSFMVPLTTAGLTAPTREPWWRWTVWLCAAMSMRRPEFALHDAPELIHWAASVAACLDEIAEMVARVLYFADHEELAAKRRRGRPTDRLRRQLDNILREGGLSKKEIADLIEDPAGPKSDRLRGRRRRAKAAAKPKPARPTTPRKSKRTRRA